MNEPVAPDRPTRLECIMFNRDDASPGFTGR